MSKSFFISYNKADRPWAEWIAWTLEDHGYTTIIQAWDFLPGSNFVLEMQNATAQADCVIALLSQPYLDALYTHSEWATAFAQDPKGNSGRLLPVKVGECSLRGILATIVYVDLSGLDEGAATEELLVAASRKRTKPLNPPAFPNSNKSLPHKKPPFPLTHNSSNPEPRKYIQEINVTAKSRKLRWKLYILSGLIGFALGLIGALGVYKSFKEDKVETVLVPKDDSIFIFGSGTVYSYLQGLDAFTFNKRPDNNEQMKVRILQGPTYTGAKVFAHVYEQVDPMLVMAAHKLDIYDLRRTEKLSKGGLQEYSKEGKPRAIFEILLHADPLQMLLVNADKNANDTKMNKDFSDIIEMCTGDNGDELDFGKPGSKKWFNKYDVYVGSVESGTRKEWESRLGKAWPPEANLKLWELQHRSTINDETNKLRIYLGSKILVDREIERGRIKRGIKVLKMVEKSVPAIRGLYLYGFIDDSDERMSSYTLNEHVSKLLKHVLDLLSQKKLLDDECIENQRKYFNLYSDIGWIDAGRPKDNIYRAERCKMHSGIK